MTAAHQRETLDWWEHSRPRFSIYISPLVEEEAAKSDAAAAARRLEVMKDLPSLEITSEVMELATFLIKKALYPTRRQMTRPMWPWRRFTGWITC